MEIIKLMDKKIIYGLVGLGVVIALFLLIDNLAYKNERQDFIVGETVSKSGKIVSIDTNQIAFDGPYIFNLESETGELTTVAIPSMGLPMCEAYKALKI